MPFLSKYSVYEKSTFLVFSSDSSGEVETVHIGMMIRGLGFNLTEAMINKFINDYDSDGTLHLHFFNPSFSNHSRKWARRFSDLLPNNP